MSPSRETRSVVPPPRGRRPPAHILAVRWFSVLVAVTVLALLGFRLLRSGSLPGIELAGADVGALDEEALTARVEEIARERESQEIEVHRRGTGSAKAITRTYERRQLGYRVDVAATVEQILERGRQGNPAAALADQFTATVSTIEMDPIVSFEEERLNRWLSRVEDRLATDATEGGIAFDGGRVETTLPQPGMTINTLALRERAREVVLDDDEASLTAPVEEIEPEMTIPAVRAAARRARSILDGPVRLTRSGESASLSPEQIATALEVRANDGRIAIAVDPQRFERVAGSLDELGEEPENASFELRNGRVRVLGGSQGTAVNTKKLAAAFLRIATSEDRSAVAPVKKIGPSFSTADARKLDIEEQVSSFTTYHSCCEPRVENIHRIADIIRGTVVKPGEEFSINGTVGQRTRANGFVGAPAISNGEYVEEVGGGISQFATTIFNATFFGGYDFLEYKAHSYYISRYPMGREATVSWPAPDFRFLNDSNSGVYIDTSYTDTSITVTFYGNKERSVRSVSGEPHNYTSPPTQCKTNKSLGRGQRQVVQTGSRGFDITVERVFGNGDREAFDTTYLPVPEIVEKRKC